MINFYSTGEAAKKIGVSLITLKRYIAAKKIPLPPHRTAGGRVRLWTENDIENVRQLLANIANGRKTRYKKKQSAPKASRGRLSTQRSAKSKRKKQKKK